jgi:putative membrane protein
MSELQTNGQDKIEPNSKPIQRAAGWTTAVGLAAGVALLVYVLRKYHIGEVLAAVAAAGWGIALISLYRVVTLATDTAGWRQLWLGRGSPPPLRLLTYRWIGESMNNLLPVAQVGGHIARARLLGRDQRDYVNAGAATVVDFTIGVLTQAIYSVAGVALLLQRTRTAGGNINGALLLTAILFVAGFLVLYLLQRGSALEKIAAVLQKLVAGNLRSMAAQLHTGAQTINSAINAIYDSHGRLLRSIAWRLLTWLLHTFETSLIMYFLGAPISWPEALILESLGTAVRNITFPVPAGLGAQEGGFVILGGLLGLPPQLCLALSLCKRARELIVGLPALGVWAWLEGRNASH